MTTPDLSWEGIVAQIREVERVRIRQLLANEFERAREAHEYDQAMSMRDALLVVDGDGIKNTETGS